MERIKRKPFQGITNIIRFNWHYYAISFALVIGLPALASVLPENWNLIVLITASCIALSTLISLIVSWYIYDCSELYSLSWLNSLHIGPGEQLINITAGFDETSSLLLQKYPAAKLTVFDFYDPAKHTEVSIERARKAYPAFGGTININTSNIPLKKQSGDYIFLILSAHEIRNPEERVDFFGQLEQSLQPGGRLIVTEHQRDIYNFLAYTVGFFHFFSKKSWVKTFARANLVVESATQITPFISSFILKKNGTIS